VLNKTTTKGLEKHNGLRNNNRRGERENPALSAVLSNSKLPPGAPPPPPPMTDEGIYSFPSIFVLVAFPKELQVG